MQLGGRALTLTRVVIDEPGRGAGFSDLAPRLLVNLEDAAASGLLNEGARAQYGLLARADAEGRAALGALALPDDVRRTSPQGSRPELTQALARADTFLAVASSAASLLAAAAIPGSLLPQRNVATDPAAVAAFERVLPLLIEAFGRAVGHQACGLSPNPHQQP